MTLQLRKRDRTRRFSILLFLVGMGIIPLLPQTKSESHPPVSSPCHVEPADYKGWHAQRLSNRWVQLIVLPHNGGRLIQSIFAGHSYLMRTPHYQSNTATPSPTQSCNTAD